MLTLAMVFLIVSATQKQSATRKPGTRGQIKKNKSKRRSNRDKLRGLGRIYFEDSFVVSNISILQGKNGMFVSMPSYKTNQQINGKPAYQDICFPVTKEFREKLYGELLSSYEKAKTEVVELAKEQVQTPGVQTVDGKSVPKEETPFRQKLEMRK